MLSVHVIAPRVVESSSAVTSRGAGLGYAAAAIEERGFYELLPGLGVRINGISHPALSEQQETDDPIHDLGNYNRLIAGLVSDSIGRGSVPLLTGGSCNHVPGMFGGLQQAYGPAARIGLVWLDAHGDFNTPTTTYSGLLGGMPVAVITGLCYPEWRDRAGVLTPLPTDRIVMVDVRNLDDREETLIRSTAVQIARFGSRGELTEIEQTIADLADRIDYLYLHIDADILDASLQPNHPTAEPNGPDGSLVHRVIECVMTTGKVVAFAVVSINPQEPGGTISLDSGIDLLRAGVTAWAQNEPHV